MHFQYWGLRERPFQNSTDTRFAYLSEQHREGLARLLYLVEEQKLGGTLTGPYGVGKSMVMELLADKVRNRPGTLYIQIDAPPVNTLAFAKQFIARLGHRQPIDDLAAALDIIQALFAEDNPATRHLVLTIDEAQMLRETASFEFLHLLSNIRVRRHAHSLTGMGGTVGEAEISVVGEELSAAAKAGDFARCGRLVAALQQWIVLFQDRQQLEPT